MFSNGECWHYFAVKKVPALLRGVTLRNHGDFYCLNFIHSFIAEKKTWIELNNDLHDLEMHDEGT